jgi:hypothetical protein
MQSELDAMRVALQVTPPPRSRNRSNSNTPPHREFPKGA